MILEIRTYLLRAGAMREYLDLYEAEGFPAQRQILGGFVGSFVTEIGTLNQITHLWAFRDADDRTTRRAKLAADPMWQAAVVRFIGCIVSQESKIVVPTSQTKMLASFLPRD